MGGEKLKKEVQEYNRGSVGLSKKDRHCLGIGLLLVSEAIDDPLQSNPSSSSQNWELEK